MKYSLSLFIILFALISCKQEPKVASSTFKKQNVVRLPQHSVDYFTFSDEEINRYKTAFKNLKAPVFIQKDTEVLLFPFSEWTLTASILKEQNYTNTDIENFLRYGGQLEKEQERIEKKNIATKEGFTLNTTKQELLNFFGEPTNSSATEQHLTWKYSMKENTQKAIALQPFLSNELNYTIDAYFEDNQLKALIYAYQVK